MTESRTSTQNRLSINLGNTVAERLESVCRIKNAMAEATMLLVANGMQDQNDPRFQVYQEFYLEANYLEGVLKEI